MDINQKNGRRLAQGVQVQGKEASQNSKGYQLFSLNQLRWSITYLQQSTPILSRHFNDVDKYIHPYNQHTNQDTETI